MEKKDKGLTDKIGEDSLVENTPKFVVPICLPKPKSSEFQ